MSSVSKIVLLTILCVQTASYNLLRSYSGSFLGETWSKNSVLMVTEIIKLIISLLMIIIENKESPFGRILLVIKESPCMAKLAIIFLIMNLLSFMSLDLVDATTFMTCSQMKILTTAGFSVIIMKKKINYRKWRALILLALGVILVSIQKYKENDKKELKWEIVGILLILTQNLLSGFVGVFFENILKADVFSIWERNVQLAIYSIMFYFPLAIYEGPVFNGWTIHSVIICIIGGFGGLMVALTVKYTDSIMKTFATSGAIIIAVISGYFFTDEPIDISVCIGIMCTILSLMNYREDDCTCKEFTGLKKEEEKNLISV